MSSLRIIPSLVALLAMIGPAELGGCAKPSAVAALPTDALDHAIANAIGDPATCVLVAERGTGKVVYRYGEAFNCVRGVPLCDRPGFMSATQALALAATPGGRAVSCASNADDTRSVGWSEGRVVSAKRDLIYSALMEGQTALPGHEISARLDAAFAKAGL